MIRGDFFWCGAALLFACLACNGRGPHAVTRTQNFVLENGDLSLEIAPADGARTVSFALGSRNVLASRDESPEAYGCSFWPSPQSDWGWPPPAAFDKLAWRTQIDGESLVLQSATDPKLLLSATERVTAEPERGAFRFEYTLHNDGSMPRQAAAWQNSRMRPRGLTFFPSTDPMHSDAQHDIAPQNGVIWFQHDPSARTQGEKFFGDG
ncbi:MAG TPA: hypothetical protein VGM44_00885, partial [Polyangiaceae bacterium]